jgi:HAMP domain-containing protein
MEKRKKYLVDKEFQFKMVSRVVFYIILTIILSGFLTYAITAYVESKSDFKLYGTTLGKPNEMVSVNRLFIVKPVIDRALVTGGIVTIIVAAISMFYYSHRLAGPVYRLEKKLEEIISGNYEGELQFREKDEFHQLAGIINRLQDKLKQERNVLGKE